MPGIIKVKIIEAKDLPVMDRASDLTDAFVELRLGSTTFKTDVYRKSLNPVWDSEWYKFEVDDEELQEDYLQLKVLDHDVYSSHDMIGKVNINLDVVVSSIGSSELSGFFPIYDTLHGIRGFIRVKIRMQFINDMNKYRQTSCGVQFYSAGGIPSGYSSTFIQGLVHELLVNDDPEYQWIDKIRTPRASNEARQRLFIKMAGEIKRKIGLKALEMGGNAVIGYQQYFDLEGETGIVLRGIGTSVTLIKEVDTNSGFPHQSSIEEHHPRLPAETLITPKLTPFINVRGISVSSESEDRNVDGSDQGNALRGLQFPRTKACIEDLEFPFFTLFNPPNGFIVHLGGIVSSRSVKLLDKINNPDDPETRDSWWTEIRTEIRSHTKAMGCHAVLGYSEYTTICDGLIVLSAYGTAAVIKLAYINNQEQTLEASLTDNKDVLEESVDFSDGECLLRRKSFPRQLELDASSGRSSLADSVTSQQDYGTSLPGCHICHVPYSDVDLQLPITLAKCAFCRQDKVPDILLATVEIPEDIPITGTGCIIQARVIRTKKKEKDEVNAENVSQILPFLEFDLHQQLINKLKLKGMNAVFGMKTRLSIGEQVIVGVMTGTAVYLTALPQPPILFVAGRNDSAVEGEKERVVDIQKKLIEITRKNQRFFNLRDREQSISKDANHFTTNMDDHRNAQEDNKAFKLDLLSEAKEAYILEVDDQSDTIIASLLSDRNFDGFDCETKLLKYAFDGGILVMLGNFDPVTTYVDIGSCGFGIFNTQSTPGFPALHQDSKFISLFKSWKIPSFTSDDQYKLSKWLTDICDSMILNFRLKVRNMLPCCLMKVGFDVKITDNESFQLTVNTFASRIDERYSKPKQSCRKYSRSESSLDGKAVEKIIAPKSNLVSKFHPPVIISPLDHLPNSHIIRYVGNINLFLIRESTDVKEDGGLNLFMQKFMNEIHTIVRAHVLAMGGNAILSFHVIEIILFFNPHKNQTQCLVNVSGDAAEIKMLPSEQNFYSSENPSSTSSLSHSPRSYQPPEVIEEIKFKLDRAVYGTSV